MRNASQYYCYTSSASFVYVGVESLITSSFSSSDTYSQHRQHYYHNTHIKFLSAVYIHVNYNSTAHQYTFSLPIHLLLLFSHQAQESILLVTLPLSHRGWKLYGNCGGYLCVCHTIIERELYNCCSIYNNYVMPRYLIFLDSSAGRALCLECGVSWL